MVLLSILIMMVASIILMDLVPLFKDWLGRIHIGRYENLESWNKAVTLKGIQWLKHTPKIKVTDNTRLIIIDKLKGNYSNKAIQYWQEAGLIMGLTEYLQDNSDEEVELEIKRFLGNKFDTNGDWRQTPEHIDAAILAYSIMKINFIDTDHYKPALDRTLEIIKDHIGKDGTVQYRKHMPNYRYVDTIGFICPFLVAYGKKYKKYEYIYLAVRQIQYFHENGMLSNKYIPFHAYKVGSKTPLGLYGWGRGLGWFAIGLIDTWNELQNMSKEKQILEKLIKEFTHAIIKCQQDNGGWNWNVTRAETRADSSTTVTLAWFLLNVAKIEDLSEKCLSSTEKALNYLMKVTRRNGAVDFSQGDTKDIGVYSMLFNNLPFTQGFCIRVYNLYENLIKLRNKNND